MNLLRAQGTWFTDDRGRQYLDALNNVSHVGHGHPTVIAAATRQMRKLNTNSRFVYPVWRAMPNDSRQHCQTHLKWCFSPALGARPTTSRCVSSAK